MREVGYAEGHRGRDSYDPEEEIVEGDGGEAGELLDQGQRRRREQGDRQDLAGVV